MSKPVIPSPTAYVHWNIRRGNDYRETWTWTKSSVAVDMSGGTVEATFHVTHDGAAVVTANTGNGKLTGNASGQFVWALDASTDISLLPPKGVFKLRYTTGGGVPEDPVAGTFEIEEDE